MADFDSNSPDGGCRINGNRSGIFCAVAARYASIKSIVNGSSGGSSTQSNLGTGRNLTGRRSSINGFNPTAVIAAASAATGSNSSSSSYSYAADIGSDTAGYFISSRLHLDYYIGYINHGFINSTLPAYLHGRVGQQFANRGGSGKNHI